MSHYDQQREEHSKKIHALNSQVGGDHYKKLKVEPLSVLPGFSDNLLNILSNSYGYEVASAFKYLCRLPFKGKFVEDLKKTVHYLKIHHDGVAEKTKKLQRAPFSENITGVFDSNRPLEAVSAFCVLNHRELAQYTPLFLAALKSAKDESALEDYERMVAFYIESDQYKEEGVRNG